MTTVSLSSKQHKMTGFHSDFMSYVGINHDGVRRYLRAIATNAVGRAITLAAIGATPKELVMPNMSEPARCRIVLPESAWVNNLDWVANPRKSQARYLEMICWQISGAVAENFFDEFDYYGNLGLGDIEGSYDLLSAYESVHGVPYHLVLGAANFVLERLLGQHFKTAEDMIDCLHEQGRLQGHELKHYLENVAKEGIGQQVLAALQEPWIEDEAERAVRAFIGS